MEFILIEYRDPLFGIIVLFLLITIISYLNYKIGKRNNSKEIETIKTFVKNFENSDKIEDIKLLRRENISPKSLLMLGKLYEKNGNIQKAINIYLLLLEEKSIIEDRRERHIILSKIGNCYLKAGLLKKSENFFKESLRLFPRNRLALNSLIILYEKLKKYEEILNILEALEELGEERESEKRYFQAVIILNDKKFSIEEKLKKILLFIEKEEIILRLYLEFLIKNRMEINYQLIDNLELKDVIDILWFYTKNSFKIENSYNNKILNAIFYAKNISNRRVESNILELDIIAILNKNGYQKATLSFEYICIECKNIFPIHFYRCPHCNSFASAKIEPIIVKRASLDSPISFL